MTTLPRMFEPRRELGRTGFKATVLGIGDLADRSIDMDTCIATAQRAMDAGLNVIDTAPGYENGYSEQIVGKAVRGRRDSLFVIDKIDQLEEPVGPQVDASLANMGLDHTDIFMFHGLSSLELWAKLSAPGGGFDQLGRCVKAGKTRFRGISSHNADVLAAAVPSGLVDVVMFGIGPFVNPRYVEEILPLTRQHQVGTVCFKTFGAGKLLGDTTGYNRPLEQRPRGKFSSGGVERESDPTALPRLTVPQCLHYTMTCDPDVALLGLSYPNEQDAAFAAALRFKPMTPEAMADLRSRGADAMQGKGPSWWG